MYYMINKLWHVMKSGYFTIIRNARDLKANKKNHNKLYSIPVCIQKVLLFFIVGAKSCSVFR